VRDKMAQKILDQMATHEPPDEWLRELAAPMWLQPNSQALRLVGVLATQFARMQAQIDDLHRNMAGEVVPFRCGVCFSKVSSTLGRCPECGGDDE
jgi:hypothetical protein